MTTTTRTREVVLTELAEKRHQAGRMTVVSPGYEPLHGEIDALVDELLAISKREDALAALAPEGGYTAEDF